MARNCLFALCSPLDCEAPESSGGRGKGGGEEKMNYGKEEGKWRKAERRGGEEERKGGRLEDPGMMSVIPALEG